MFLTKSLRRGEKIMKIGKDEIGPVGIIGLILIAPSVYLTYEGLISLMFDGFLYLAFLETIIGVPLLIIAFTSYYVDMFRHRKKNKQNEI